MNSVRPCLRPCRRVQPSPPPPPPPPPPNRANVYGVDLKSQEGNASSKEKASEVPLGENIDAHGEKDSLVFLVCIYLCGAYFFYDKWVNLCGVDLLKSQEGSASSNSRRPKYR